MQLNASGGTSYQWSPAASLNDATIAMPISTINSTTTFTVIISNSTTVCPADTLTLTVIIDSKPNVDAGMDDTIILGSGTTLNATGTGTFNWSPSTGLNNTSLPNPVATPDQTTTYTVTLTDLNGCKNSDAVTIWIIDDDSPCNVDLFFVPNAFTPNNDDNNDILKVYADANMELVRFMIYDRWGSQMFYTEDISQGWDGSFQNSDMNSGVFVYYLEIRCPNDDILIRQGDITLIK